MTRTIIIVFWFLASCVTTSPHERSPENRGIDLPTTNNQGVQYTPPTDRDLLSFIQKHSNQSQLLSNGDLEMISRVAPRPEAGSVQEAALAVTALKKVLAPENAPTQSAYEVSTTQPKAVIPARNAVGVAPPKTPTTQNSLLSLEKASENVGVDYVAALDKNILLKNTNFFVMTQKASERGVNSESFQKSLRDVLGREIAQWKGVAVGTSDQAMQIPIVESTPAPAVSAPPPQSPDLAAIPNAQTASADEVTTLKDAQSLADSGQFKSAIEKAEAIPAGSPNYIYAQDRAKYFSNLAVQDLRRKAAAEFQSAIPVVDQKVKRSYLERAENWLKEALEKYPKAENLSTVKDNLAVVQKELDSLNRN